MANLEEYVKLVPASRRTLNLFLMVDISASMSGEKIAAVNDAMRNVMPIVSEIGESNPDAEIKVSVLTFNHVVTWLTKEPVCASQFQWQDQKADGCTAMGGACEELNGKLSHKHGFLKSASGSYAPVIIMLSDGQPTDEFTPAMNRLKENAWFKHSTRLAIAIGNDADIEVLKEFTGNAELVFRVHNIDALKTAIKVLVISSSMVSSQSSSIAMTATASNGNASDAITTKSEQTAELIQEELEGSFGIDVGDAAMIDSLDIDAFD